MSAGSMDKLLDAESTYLWQFDGEVADEDISCALPLLRWGWNLLFLELVLAHRWHAVDDDPRDCSVSRCTDASGASQSSRSAHIDCRRARD